jgi:phage terminase large subunit GpA-like protein
LALTDAGARYCHFPINYSEDYFKGLCSEKKIVTYSAGKKIRRYEKLTASTRNEPLDCRVYNMATLYILNPKYEVLHKRMLAQQDKNHIIIEKNTRNNDKISFVKNEPTPQMPIKRTRSRIKGSGFVNG